MLLGLADGPYLMEGQGGQGSECRVSGWVESRDEREVVVECVVGDELAEGGVDMLLCHF